MASVFFPSVVEGIDIFRQRDGNVYLSERFVQRWKQAKWKGLDFILAWDSDLPPKRNRTCGCMGKSDLGRFYDQRTERDETRAIVLRRVREVYDRKEALAWLLGEKPTN